MLRFRQSQRFLPFLRFCSSNEATSHETLVVDEHLWSNNDRLASSSSSSKLNNSSGRQNEFREPDFGRMQTVPRADAFARPRLVNFYNRFQHALSGYSISSVEGGGSWFRCEMTVPIFFPSASSQQHKPERVATAIGFGKSEKEAENACAMHAERILDAAGAELFSLGAMQARHAEAAFKEGRWARFPKSHPKRQEQEEEAERRKGAVFVDPPPLISFLTPEGKTPPNWIPQEQQQTQHSPQQVLPLASQHASTSTATVHQNPNVGAKPSSSLPSSAASVPATKITTTPTTTASTTSPSSTFYSRSLFLNNKARMFEEDDMIEITLDDTRDTDDSEAQHEGIEIDQAEHADWRVFPRVSQHRKVPPSFKHMDESEGGEYWMVEFGMYYECEPHSILSPHLFCAASLDRVRRYFQHHGRDFDACVIQTKLSFTAWAGQRTTLIKFTVEIPGLDDPYRVVAAVGVSKDQDRGLHLCAMHAELLVDHLGLMLFPADSGLQEQHADFCASMGRWAASEVGEVAPPTKSNPKPKPLREWGESVAIHAPKHTEESFAKAGRKVGRGSLQARRIAPLSEEEFYMHCHHCLIAPNRGHTIELNPFGSADDDGVESGRNDTTAAAASASASAGSKIGTNKIDYVEVLRQFNRYHDMQRESFYLNLDYSGVYRCTTLLPLDIKVYGLRCGYAIGSTPGEAKTLCAQHAIEVLTHFGIAVFPDDKKKQMEFEERRRREGRFVVERNAATGEPSSNLPAPTSRSPPSLRLAGPPRPVIRHDDWRAAQMIDASLFTVVDLFGSNFDRSILTAFENYCRNVFDCEHETALWSKSKSSISLNSQSPCGVLLPSPSTAKTVNGVCHISFYWGLQPVHGRFMAQANTAFAAVPLPRGHPARDALGGAASFLAVGRSNDQKNASKCFYVHALRCLDSLGLLDEYCLKVDDSSTSGVALDATKLRQAMSSIVALAVPDSKNPSKFFSWGNSPTTNCAPLRLFDDDGRPMSASRLNEQKKLHNIVVQQLPVPVMNTVLAGICNERRSSKKWKKLNDAEAK